MDFNNDGMIDIVAGTYDGSPHVSLGSSKGFARPAQIPDKDGQRIIQNAWWNYDARKWETSTRCDAQKNNDRRAHGTSAIAYDVDHDGDYDLLLGDYAGGEIQIRMNGGNNKKPAFETLNIQLTVDGQLLQMPGSLATLRAVDWDKDGTLDLVCGSMGAQYPKSNKSAVYWLKAKFAGGTTVFDKPRGLIPVPAANQASPADPSKGIYPDVGDVDGDGDLDLVAGGNAVWKVPDRELTGAEKARAKKLGEEIVKLKNEAGGIHAAIEARLAGLPESVMLTKRAALRAERQRELTALQQKISDAESDLAALTPGEKTSVGIWLYERVR